MLLYKSAGAIHTFATSQTQQTYGRLTSALPNIGSATNWLVTRMCLIKCLFLPLPCCRFEVEFLSARPPGLGRSQPVFAIRGPEASTELSMAELLQGITPQALPLLPHILGRPAASAAAAGALPGRAPSAAAGLGTPLRPLQGGAAAGPSGGDGSPGSPPSPSYSPTDSERSRHSSKAPAVSAGEPAAEAAAEEYGRPPQTKRAKRGAGGDDSSDLQSWRRRGGTAGAASAGVGGPEEEEPGSCNAAEDVEALIARFRLNEEQAHVVRHVANWCGSMGAQVGARAACERWDTFIHWAAPRALWDAPCSVRAMHAFFVVKTIDARLL